MSLAGGTLTSDSPTAPRLRTHRGTPARPGPIDRLLAARLQRYLKPADLAVQLWDGSTPEDSPARLGKLVIGDRRTLVGLLANPDLWFGEAYAAGRLDIDGPLEPALEALSRLSLGPPSRLTSLAARLARANTLLASRRNVHHHYDLGNDFYQLWLDTGLVYSCAVFSDPSMSLEAAQREKLDLVCRKLSLRPGERVVEAGCGWGALALHMARHYGVRVRAFNVSREQIAYARERASREGVPTSQLEFVDDDYRNVTGSYDAFVSVGMLEHVGRRRLRALADVLRRTVRRDGGRGLLHFIGRDHPRPLNAWIRRRIFPGAYTPTLAEVASAVVAPAGMSVVDVENLRLHYARTLAHWRERFDTVADVVASRHGESFRRAWQLYLAGSEAAFATGWLQLFQVVFAPAESAPPFWSRRQLYSREGVS